MKGICVGLLAFLLCACASTEIQEIVEVKTPETALVNELGHVEDNLMMSEALGGFTQLLSTWKLWLMTAMSRWTFVQKILLWHMKQS